MILDCTLRDGGYYTNWDFPSSVVDSYIEAVNALPIDVVEIGYRNNPSEEYLGRFGYTPMSDVRQLRKKCDKKLAIMLNEKSVRISDLSALVDPLSGCVDVIRLAVDPKNLERALVLGQSVRERGFELAFNLMYMSRWMKDESFLAKLAALDGSVDMFNMVDSFGGVTPEELELTIDAVRKRTLVPLGFHGHNNLHLALANTIVAIKRGLACVDATVLGMGRGAGNLELELLLTYLNKQCGLAVDFNVLGDMVSAFEPLRERYRWGTNLPYMLSGANNIPQQDVMDWVSNRVYSFNSIVRALDNRRNNEPDNARFPKLNPKRYSKVLVIGGGPNATGHAAAIREFLSGDPKAAVVFATTRQAREYADVPNDCYFCLVGNEGRRLMKTVGKRACESICVLPPYPREMGTEVPDGVASCTYELDRISFTDSYRDSVTTVALQLASELTEGEVLVVGYDGYSGGALSEKEVVLSRENREIFTAFNRNVKQLFSLTPSVYSSLAVKSVYQFL